MYMYFVFDWSHLYVQITYDFRKNYSLEPKSYVNLSFSGSDTLLVDFSCLYKERNIKYVRFSIVVITTKLSVLSVHKVNKNYNNNMKLSLGSLFFLCDDEKQNKNWKKGNQASGAQQMIINAVFWRVICSAMIKLNLGAIIIALVRTHTVTIVNDSIHCHRAMSNKFHMHSIGMPSRQS